jgi:hypothetical protein
VSAECRIERLTLAEHGVQQVEGDLPATGRFG